MPPYGASATPTPDHGELVGQNQKADRNHPEAEDRKEAEQPAKHEGAAQSDAGPTRARKVKIASQQRDLSPRRLERLAIHVRHSVSSACKSHAHKIGPACRSANLQPIPI